MAVNSRRYILEERLATIASLKPVFYPRSIAVIGASQYPRTIGNLIICSLIGAGYKGAIYPVNPNCEIVCSMKTYPSVLAIPGEVEMAVIVVSAQAVAKVAK